MYIKDKLIKALVKNDIYEWRDQTDRDSYLELLLIDGFVGYRHQDVFDLMSEFVERNILCISPSKECNTCHFEEGYVCLECEHNQVHEYFEKLEITNA